MQLCIPPHWSYISSELQKYWLILRRFVGIGLKLYIFKMTPNIYDFRVFFVHFIHFQNWLHNSEVHWMSCSSGIFHFKTTVRECHFKRVAICYQPALLPRNLICYFQSSCCQRNQSLYNMYIYIKKNAAGAHAVGECYFMYMHNRTWPAKSSETFI